MRVLLAHALNPKRRRIARVLAEAGHEVAEVASPAAALEHCRAWAPDVCALSLARAQFCTYEPLVIWSVGISPLIQRIVSRNFCAAVSVTDA